MSWITVGSRFDARHWQEIYLLPNMSVLALLLSQPFYKLVLIVLPLECCDQAVEVTTVLCLVPA